MSSEIWAMLEAIGTISATIVALFLWWFSGRREEQRRKYDIKREKLRVLHEVINILHRYRNRFDTIRENFLNPDVLHQWQGNLQLFSDQIPQRVSQLYNWSIIEDVPYEDLMDFAKKLQNYSIDIYNARVKIERPRGIPLSAILSEPESDQLKQNLIKTGEELVKLSWEIEPMTKLS